MTEAPTMLAEGPRNAAANLRRGHARFTEADADAANAEWGCNCGPGALAAITGLTLDEVRPHLTGFDQKHYTNPTMMWDALNSIGKPWRKIGRDDHSRGAVWPIYGLVRIQWEGPWTQPGVPMRVRYRYTHWVGSWITSARGHGIFDINCMNNGSGWCARSDWEATIVPAITAQYPRASGKWHVTHGVEVEA